MNVATIISLSYLKINDLASSLASRSISKRASISFNIGDDINLSVVSMTHSVILPNETFSSKNAATAISFAAFMAQGAEFLDSAALYARSSRGKVSVSGFANEREAILQKSSSGVTDTLRRGCVIAY